MTITRRELLRTGLVSAAAISVTSLAPKAFASMPITPYNGVHARAADPVRELSFYSTHTFEKGTFTFFRDGDFDTEGLRQINHILRDHRSGEVKAIDPHLLQLLYDLRRTFGTHEPFSIISGYRSPATNAMLAAQSGGVAQRSLHMDGMAIDIRVPGVRTSALRDHAKQMQRGGVGYYAASDFVHVDTGRVRFW